MTRQRGMKRGGVLEERGMKKERRETAREKKRKLFSSQRGWGAIKDPLY